MAGFRADIDDPVGDRRGRVHALLGNEVAPYLLASAGIQRIEIALAIRRPDVDNAALDCGRGGLKALGAKAPLPRQLVRRTHGQPIRPRVGADVISREPELRPVVVDSRPRGGAGPATPGTAASANAAAPATQRGNNG